MAKKDTSASFEKIIEQTRAQVAAGQASAKGLERLEAQYTQIMGHAYGEKAGVTPVTDVKVETAVNKVADAIKANDEKIINTNEDVVDAINSLGKEMKKSQTLYTPIKEEREDTAPGAVKPKVGQSDPFAGLKKMGTLEGWFDEDKLTGILGTMLRNKIEKNRAAREEKAAQQPIVPAAAITPTTPERARGSKKEGSDGMYTWQGAQWTSDETGRIATKAEAANLNEATSSEAREESQRAQQEQTNLLKQLVANTSIKGEEGEGATDDTGESADDGETKADGILSNIIDSITSAFKGFFKPASILKFLGKALPILAIVGSIANGLIDGIKEYMESGDLGEAIIKGFGGMLSFLTFGIFDAESIRGLVEGVKGLYTEYIEKPISDLANSIKGIFADVGSFFTDAFTSLKNVIAGIGLPEFTIGPFGPLGPWKFGPYYPFKGDDATTTDLTKKQDLVPLGEMTGETTSSADTVSNSAQQKQIREIDYQIKMIEEGMDPSMSTVDPIQGEKDIEALKQKKLQIISSNTTPSVTSSPDTPAPATSRPVNDKRQQLQRELTVAERRGKLEDVKRINKELGELEAQQMRSSSLAPTPPPSSGNTIEQKTVEANEAARAPATTVAPVVISAPQTNVKSTSNYTAKPSTRNTDSTVRDISRSQFAVY